MININFDFTKEAMGNDPDSNSPTLIKYHKILWQKTVKKNTLFDLKIRGNRLTHSSHLGMFELSSDSIGNTYRKWKRMSSVIKKVSMKDIESFWKTCRTFGGYIVFPARQINGKDTINQARGKKTIISDRWDLTVECIKRHYEGRESPLSNVLERYSDFFSLFNNFKGYIEFFHLQDIVSDDFKRVKFYLPFDDFQRSIATPKTKEEYLTYRQAVMLFINQRNTRILDSL